MPVWSAPPSNAPSATADTRPPSAVTGLRLLANSDTTISLAWDAGQDNVAVKLYVVRGDGFSSFQTTDTKANVSWPHRTANVTVQVSAVDTSGNQGEWRSLSVNAPGSAAAGTTAPAPTSAPATTTDPAVTTSAPSTPSDPPSTDLGTTAPASSDPSAVQSAAVQDPGTAGATDPSSTQSV